MAGSVLRLILAVAVTIFLFAQTGAGKDFAVGGSLSWEVPPSDNTQLYSQWAQKNRFMIGDSLVFTYDAAKDSVLLVTKYAYENCKTDSYIQSFKDGHTVVKLNHSGPYHFISGNADHCKKHEKLIVVVLAERRASGPSSPQPSPAIPTSSPPSPTSGTGGAPTSPTPSPSETSDMVPESDHKKKNGASSVLMGSLGGFGAILGSFVMMVL